MRASSPQSRPRHGFSPPGDRREMRLLPPRARTILQDISRERNTFFDRAPSSRARSDMSAGQPTSVTLLQRLRAREADAWERMLHLYTPLVRAWCHHHGVGGADAYDVDQEVFQAVVTGLGQFQRDRPGDTFRGWLRGITRHKLLDFFRRQSAQPRAQGGTAAGRQMQEVPQPEMTLPEETPEQVADL